MTAVRFAILAALVLAVTALTPASSPAAERPVEPKSGAEARSESPGVYYHFKDVLVPRELELDRGESFVYEAAGINAGLLVFSGRVEVRSLTRFFIEAMAHDGWSLAARFTNHKVLLQFDKPGKRAVIYITETTFSTRVEIWLGPHLAGVKK